jgi:transcriptional regulator with GAF, ATPase, and Fis domain
MTTNKENTAKEIKKQLWYVQQQVQDFEKLNNVLKVICSSLDVDEILERIINEAINLCDADEGTIMMFGEEKREVTRTLIRQRKEATKTKLDRYLNNLLAGWISRHRKPVAIENLVDIFGEEKVTKTHQDISSALSIPIELSGKLIGVINLISLQPHIRFAEREIRLMQILASQCAQFIVNAKLYNKLFTETLWLRKEVKDKYTFSGIIGRSPKMMEVFALLEKIIPTEGRVLIEGESGTGKEMVAHVLHYNGPRKDGPFVAIDCGAVPANLLESELFGHVKGAFTGALLDKKGLFEEANGGTLFLDEIVNMPSEAQVKLLRAIQEDEIRPLGSNQVHKIDVRIIAAASGSLKNHVETCRLKQELYYRLNIININLPPLRERKQDIVILANHFLGKIGEKCGKNVMALSADTLAYLEAYTWPGNVRELENVIERMVILADQNTEKLKPDLLPAEIKLQPFGKDVSSAQPPSLEGIRSMKEKYEKILLLEALIQHEWNQSSVARELEISEHTVRYKMQKYGIKKTKASFDDSISTRLSK